LQLTATHKVSTPVNWRPGEDVIISGSVSNNEARELFSEWESPRPYIRIVPQPREREPRVLKREPAMILKQYYLGCLAHASYLIADEEAGEAAVVDPQRDVEQYLEDTRRLGCRIANCS
jgi:C-terminal domain of 1-Cys peroxiredoxin